MQKLNFGYKIRYLSPKDKVSTLHLSQIDSKKHRTNVNNFISISYFRAAELQQVKGGRLENLNLAATHIRPAH